MDWPEVLRWLHVTAGPQGCCPRAVAVSFVPCPLGGTGKREAPGSVQLLAGLIRDLVFTLAGEKQPLPTLQCRGACHPYLPLRARGHLSDRTSLWPGFFRVMFCARNRVQWQCGQSFLTQGRSEALRAPRSGLGRGAPAASFGADSEWVELSWSEPTRKRSKQAGRTHACPEPGAELGPIQAPPGRLSGAPHLSCSSDAWLGAGQPPGHPPLGSASPATPLHHLPVGGLGQGA